MSQGFYGQVNGSLFKAEYRGLDKKLRPQLYDRGYMVKLLSGKEWMMGKRKQNVFNISAKYTLQNKTPYAHRFDLTTGELRYDKAGISLPNLFYRLEF